VCVYAAACVCVGVRRRMVLTQRDSLPPPDIWFQ
jgi:hypothetical protein